MVRHRTARFDSSWDNEARHRMASTGRNRNVRCGVRNVNKQTFVHEHCQRQMSTQVRHRSACQRPRNQTFTIAGPMALRPIAAVQSNCTAPQEPTSNRPISQIATGDCRSLPVDRSNGSSASGAFVPISRVTRSPMADRRSSLLPKSATC